MHRFKIFSLLLIALNLSVQAQVGATLIKIKLDGQPFVFDDALLKLRPDCTLTKALLNDQMTQRTQDEEGYFILDGSPKHFKHILDFWRYGDADVARGNVDLDLLYQAGKYWAADDFCCFIAGVKKGIQTTPEYPKNITFKVLRNKLHREQNTVILNQEIEDLAKDFHILDVNHFTNFDEFTITTIKLVPKEVE